MKNQRGQMTIEMILIAIIFAGIALAFLQRARDQGWAQALTEKPWAYVQGMIEDGVWVPAGAQSRRLNPGMFARHGSPEGDVVN